MQQIHEIITKYIDEAVERAVEKTAGKAADKAAAKVREDIKGDFEHHTTALLQAFQDETKKIAKMTRSYTTRTDVKEIVVEETASLRQDVELIKKEVKSINKKLASI